MDDFESTLANIKETMIFLIEQAKAHAEEVNACNQKIDALTSYVEENIVNPSIEAYKEEQFNDFNDKYGERLGKFNGTLQTSLNEPEYDATREAFNELDALPQEEREGIDEEAYVAGVEQGLEEYVQNIKQSLGLPEDTAVEITDNGEGDIEVVADTDGDGVPETEVTEESSEETVEMTEDEGEGEPSQEDIDAYLRGDDLKEDEEDKKEE